MPFFLISQERDAAGLNQGGCGRGDGEGIVSRKCRGPVVRAE